MTSLLKAFLPAAAAFAVAAQANAAIITFDEFAEDHSYSRTSVLTEGFTISGTLDDVAIDSILFWGKNEVYNADQGGTTLAPNHANSFNTFTRQDGLLFNILSMDIADGLNDGSGVWGGGATSVVTFAFSTTGGVIDIEFAIDDLVGFENVVFNIANVISFSATNPVGGYQLDNINYSLVNASAVPEPASWAMMIAGFGMIGAGMRWRNMAASVRFA